MEPVQAGRLLPYRLVETAIENHLGLEAGDRDDRGKRHRILLGGYQREEEDGQHGSEFTTTRATGNGEQGTGSQ
jgi:hypothetical protein